MSEIKNEARGKGLRLMLEVKDILSTGPSLGFAQDGCKIFS